MEEGAEAWLIACIGSVWNKISAAFFSTEFQGMYMALSCKEGRKQVQQHPKYLNESLCFLILVIS